VSNIQVGCLAISIVPRRAFSPRTHRTSLNQQVPRIKHKVTLAANQCSTGWAVRLGRWNLRFSPLLRMPTCGYQADAFSRELLAGDVVGSAVAATLTTIAIRNMKRDTSRSACRTSIPTSQMRANNQTPITSMLRVSKGFTHYPNMNASCDLNNADDHQD